MVVDSMRFQKDDDIRHIARQTIQLKHESFPGRVIFNFSDQDSPPRSYDLTTLDFFLWGLLKSKIYVNKASRKFCAVSIKFSHIYAK